MKSCPGYISETVRFRKLVLGRGCSCTTSWSYLDLTFDLAVVTLTYKILSRLYLENCKVWEVDTWLGYWLGGVGVQHHGVTLI